MSELREMIEKTLKEMDALDMKISVEKYQEEIGANDKENIGVLSDGTRYYKKMVYKYLTENGYRMSPEYVEIAARKFPVNESNEEKITVNREKAVEHNDLQDVREEDLATFLQLKILEQLAELKNNFGERKYQYTVDAIYDNRHGGTDVEALKRSLTRHGEQGYRLKEMITNELGKNSMTIGVGNYSSGVNSTQDQVVLVYEKLVEL